MVVQPTRNVRLRNPMFQSYDKKCEVKSCVLDYYKDIREKQDVYTNIYTGVLTHDYTNN